MFKKPSTATLVAAGALALVAMGLVLAKKKVGGVADVAAGAMGVLGDVATGTVLGIGDAIGIPRTNMTECERAIAEGRTWDASFACPAGTFISSVFNPSTPVPIPTKAAGDTSASTGASTSTKGIDEITYDFLGNPIF